MAGSSKTSLRVSAPPSTLVHIQLLNGKTEAWELYAVGPGGGISMQARATLG